MIDRDKLEAALLASLQSKNYHLLGWGKTIWRVDKVFTFDTNDKLLYIELLNEYWDRFCLTVDDFHTESIVIRVHD